MKIPIQNRSIIKMLFILIAILSCNEKCDYDEDFLNNNIEIKPRLLITSNNSSCNELFLKGYFFYNWSEFDINKKIHLSDSAYLYTSSNNNNILFDFSEKKKIGVLKVNDTLKLSINYFMDIKSTDGTFRLFKVDKIGKFHDLNLSNVFITNYNYGIVGDFVAAKENDKWYVINYEGYIPNEKYFFSIFQPAKLL